VVGLVSSRAHSHKLDSITVSISISRSVYLDDVTMHIGR
jgi:hypothetical protein